MPTLTLPFGLSISPRVLYEILTGILKGLEISFFRDDLFAESKEVMDEAITRLGKNGFPIKQMEPIQPGMAPAKLLGLTVSSVNDQLWWSREEKFPGEHIAPSGTVTIREAMGYLARLLPSGLVPVANWLRPTVASLRSLLTTQANVDGWDTRVSPAAGKKLEQLGNALYTLGNPMRGPWHISGCETV